MITEDYVSFEVAKLLKEKGFESFTTMVYRNPNHPFIHNEKEELIPNHYHKKRGDVNEILAPTHQMAMKWLRETHGIDIIIEISDPSVKDRKYYCMIWDGNNNSHILDLFNTYEDAVEAALRYALENLV